MVPAALAIALRRRGHSLPRLKLYLVFRPLLLLRSTLISSSDLVSYSSGCLGRALLIPRYWKYARMVGVSDDLGRNAQERGGISIFDSIMDSR
jgi:hypothetical protein